MVRVCGRRPWDTAVVVVGEQTITAIKTYAAEAAISSQECERRTDSRIRSQSELDSTATIRR